MASHGLSVVKLRRGRAHGLVEGRRARQRLQSPLPHRHPLPRRRPGGRHRADADQRRPRGPHRARHAQQLRRRRHALGHCALRRGEHQPVLRDHGTPAGVRHVVRPLRHRGGPERRPWAHRRPPLRPGGGAARALPLRLDRRGRPLRHEVDAAQAHDAGPLQARGRQRRRLRRSGHAVAYMGDDEKGEYLYKFVSADTVRPAVPARREAPQHAAARPGHAVRRGADRRQADPATPSTTASVDWIPLCSDTESFVDGHVAWPTSSIDTRLAADTGRRHADGPSRGRRHQPGQRPRLRLPDQQRPARAKFPVDEPNPSASPGRAARRR